MSLESKQAVTLGVHGLLIGVIFSRLSQRLALWDKPKMHTVVILIEISINVRDVHFHETVS